MYSIACVAGAGHIKSGGHFATLTGRPIMSAKPRSLEEIDRTVGAIERKVDSHDHQLRGPDGVHTQVALVKSELSQIVWLGRIILGMLAGLFIADVYRTVQGRTERTETRQVQPIQQVKGQSMAPAPTKTDL